MGNIHNFIAFFNRIDEILLVLNTDGKIIYVNDTAVNMLGYSREELLELTALELHPEETREEASIILNKMLLMEDIVCPFPLVCKDGSLAEVETKVFPGEWANSPALFGISRDVSKQRISERKFQIIFESAPIPIAITRVKDGKIIDVNQAWLDLLGFTRDEVVGKTTNSVGIIKDMDGRNNLLALLKEQGYIEKEVVEFYNKTGRNLHGYFSARPITIGGDLCWITSFVDQTEQILLQKELDVIRKANVEHARKIITEKLSSNKLIT